MLTRDKFREVLDDLKYTPLGPQQRRDLNEYLETMRVNLLRHYYELKNASPAPVNQDANTPEGLENILKVL